MIARSLLVVTAATTRQPYLDSPVQGSRARRFSQTPVTGEEPWSWRDGAGSLDACLLMETGLRRAQALSWSRHLKTGLWSLWGPKASPERCRSGEPYGDALADIVDRGICRTRSPASRSGSCWMRRGCSYRGRTRGWAASAAWRRSAGQSPARVWGSVARHSCNRSFQPDSWRCWLRRHGYSGRGVAMLPC